MDFKKRYGILRVNERRDAKLSIVHMLVSIVHVNSSIGTDFTVNSTSISTVLKTLDKYSHPHELKAQQKLLTCPETIGPRT
ncbi:unnamed protein product [Malus baccata var. baccata]